MTQKHISYIGIRMLIFGLLFLFAFYFTAFASESAADSYSTGEEMVADTKEGNDSKLEKISNDSPQGESVVDIASMVITWTGFLFTIVTIAFSIIGFLGYREIGDLKKREVRINDLLNRSKQVLEKAEEAERLTRNHIDQLTATYKSNVDKVIQASYYYTVGSNKYKLGEHKEAIKYLEEAIKYNPDNTEIMCLLGKAYAHIGQTIKAEEYYLKALNIDSCCADAYRGTASLFRYSDKQKAIDNAKRAHELSPDDPEILNYYGLLLMEDGQREDALVLLLQSYQILKHPDTSFFISMIYIQEQSWGRAKKFIEEAIQGYSEEEPVGEYRELWEELSKWIKEILPPINDEKLSYSLEHLRKINQIPCSNKTRKSVHSHIMTVLNSLNINQDYFKEFESIYII